MDAQLKKGVLDACVLAAISKQDSYGYQIVKDVSTCVDISESTLYPILKRLEVAGALKTYSIEHNGRLRKYYRITDEGRRRIDDFGDSWSEMVRIHDYIEEARHHDQA